MHMLPEALVHPLIYSLGLLVRADRGSHLPPTRGDAWAITRALRLRGV
jgi:hypothetical protein